MADADRKRAEFAKWALPHMDQVYTAGLYLTRNKEEAEDLLQETMLRAYRFWHQFTPGTNCKAWLMTILHNSFKNRYRDRSREQQTVEFDESLHAPDQSASAELSQTNPEEIVAAQRLDDEMERALRSLPAEFLEAIVLVDIQELTYEEAAGVLGCPIGTIRSRLSRGRQLLHSALQQYAQQRGFGRRNSYALR